MANLPRLYEQCLWWRLGACLVTESTCCGAPVLTRLPEDGFRLVLSSVIDLDALAKDRAKILLEYVSDAEADMLHVEESALLASAGVEKTHEQCRKRLSIARGWLSNEPPVIDQALSLIHEVRASLLNQQISSAQALVSQKNSKNAKAARQESEPLVRAKKELRRLKHAGYKREDAAAKTEVNLDLSKKGHVGLTTIYKALSIVWPK